jgi:hypothetical protein
LSYIENDTQAFIINKSDDEKSIVESINSVKSKNPFDKIINKFKKKDIRN